MRSPPGCQSRENRERGGVFADVIRILLRRGKGDPFIAIAILLHVPTREHPKMMRAALLVLSVVGSTGAMGHTITAVINPRATL